MNFAIYHYGGSGDDIKEDIVRYLPRDWNICFFGPCISKSGLKKLVEYENVFVEDIYSHPVFKGKLTPEQVADAERWIEFPYNLMLDFCPVTVDSLKMNDLDVKRELLAK